MTIGEILDAFKSGAITREQGVGWIELAIARAEAAAKLGMIAKFDADIKQILDASKPQ